MKKVASGFLSLVLAAGLCFSPETVVNVQGAPGSSLAAMEVAQEDREMEEHLLMEAQPQVPEKIKGYFAPKEENGSRNAGAGDFADGFSDGEIFEESGAFTSGEGTSENPFGDEITGDNTTGYDAIGDGTEDGAGDGSTGDGTEETPIQEVTLEIQEGQDFTSALNTLLAEVKDRATDANPCKVIIPPGNYSLTGTIIMYSNIHLYAKDAVITKTSPEKHLLLKLGAENESAPGYDGFRNVTIEGGTWDSNFATCENKDQPGGFVGFRIGHANNVTIKDVTFLNNLKSHFVELGGVKDCRITGCTFRGYYKPYEGGGQECIQLDACMDYIMPDTLPYDGTTCENIIIEGNTFEDVFAGVGSHSMMFNRPYRNITIRNNTFRNIKKRAVWCLNYVDSVVTDNIMENVGGGVYVRSVYGKNSHIVPGETPDSGQNQQPENLVVSNNKISVSKPGKIAGTFWRSYGIQVLGENVKSTPKDIPRGNYIIKGVKVTGNTVTGPGNGIRLLMAEGCEVSNNKISLSAPKEFDNLGIYLGGSSKNTVKKNTVEKALSNGIYVYRDSASKLSSNDNVITDNKVSGCYSDGMLVDATSNNTTLTANVSQKNKGSGIAVYRALLTSLSGNKTFDNARYGIYAYHANIKTHKANEMTGNKSSYAMYMNGCKGNAQNLRSIKVTSKSAGVKKLSGLAPGAKNITVSLKKNQARIGSGKISSKGNYSIPIKSQKKGTVILLSATDKYKNIVTQEYKVR